MPARPRYADPPDLFTMALTDFDQLAPAFAGWQGRFEQLSAGRFEGAVAAARGRTVRVMSVRGNQRVLVRGRSPAGLVSVYPVTPDNAGGSWQGRRLAPGEVVAVGLDGEVDHLSQRRSQYTGLSLAADALCEVARVVRRADVPPVPREWGVLTGPPDRVEALNRGMRRLLDCAGTTADAERDRIEQDCLRALVEVVFPTPAGASRAVPSLAIRSAVTRRAEELMRSRLDAPLGAIELCAELGVSDRTLRLAFRERFGLGPMAYYKAVRLNAVRAALKADPDATVATVAAAFGFHHLGNLAADYRRAFGELPSNTATARRRSGDPPG